MTLPEQSDSLGKPAALQLTEAIIVGSEDTTLYGRDGIGGAWFALEVLDLIQDLERDGWQFVPPPCSRCGGTGMRPAGDGSTRCEDCRGQGRRS